MKQLEDLEHTYGLQEDGTPRAMRVGVSIDVCDCMGLLMKHANFLLGP